ncbi:MAG: hypothetical protein E7426_08815 [Ruminococcaceae bacterium]|jgi:hypothetical protein|nr:hypothetical protein [Oscillospiraceae bacterium]
MKKRSSFRLVLYILLLMVTAVFTLYCIMTRDRRMVLSFIALVGMSALCIREAFLLRQRRRK